MAFEQGPGGLEASPQTLLAIGLKRQPPEAGGRVLLSAIPGLRYALRAADGAVDITADPAVLATQIISPAPPPVAPDAASWGGLLNYATAVTAPARGAVGYSANLEGRVFGPPGVFSSTWYAQNAAGGMGGGSGFHSLDTSFIHDDPAHMRQFIFGDFVSGAQTWSRPVRGVGFSLQTDFSLRPELITQPMPQLRGAPAVPSTVDLYIDGLKQLSQPTTGPFQIQQPPVLTGYGQVTMVVTDLTGRQSVQTFAFYGSDSLLKPGLTGYALDAGWLRVDYAGPYDHYTDPFFQATARRGLTDELTIEGRVAAAKSLGEVGAGAVFKAGQVAVVSLALDATTGRAGTGGLWQASVEHRTGPFSIYGQVSHTFGAFEDLAARAGDPPITFSALAGVGFAFRSLGNLNLNYTRQTTAQSDVGVVNVSWNRSISRGANVYVSGYASERGLRSNGISVGIIVPFGHRGVAADQVSSSNNAGAYATAYAEEAPPQRGGWGWRVRGVAGAADVDELEGGIRLQSRLIDGSGDLDVTRQGVSARGYATGSLIWMAGASPRLSSAVGQSFAVVETGHPGIEISQENRTIGRTGADGSLLVPYVGSFAPTRLDIVPATLPFALRAERSEAIVRPPREAGVVVKLPVTANRAMYLHVTRPSGKPFAVGLPVLMGGRQAAVVGYDGMVWIDNAAGQTAIEIADPDGRCIAKLPVAAPGDAAHAQDVICNAP
jgi:outer membrane usher protein